MRGWDMGGEEAGKGGMGVGSMRWLGWRGDRRVRGGGRNDWDKRPVIKDLKLCLNDIPRSQRFGTEAICLRVGKLSIRKASTFPETR